MPAWAGELDLELCIGLADPNLSGLWIGGLRVGFTGVIELPRSGR